MADRPFLDTNILLYAINEDVSRTPRAKDLIVAGSVISVQVLNEFVNVAGKKFRMSADGIADVLEPIRLDCEVVPLTVETHARAWEIYVSSNLGIYDAAIIAAAQLAGCKTLFTEDMNPGQRFGSVTVRNPFAER